MRRKVDEATHVHSRETTAQQPLRIQAQAVSEAQPWREDNWGAALQSMTKLPDAMIVIPECTPHSMDVGDEPVLVWYMWTGALRVSFWFCSHADRRPSRRLGGRAASG